MNIARGPAPAGVICEFRHAVTPHWVRHTASALLMQANVDIWLAASYLGMSAMTLERHYAHHRKDFQGVARRAL
ncbi:hypothetical protein [uncultured Caulobacter sp.]|uniref:hypothetical protein n=1 Tax=uncultured Caulobacter sp. TaxID=158749 RepID=UPI002623A78B|nr:hypothetical protein [uncultured Caulobacter sp.]